eukprot:11180208-Alexandrium_andersonii.AAC.1
MPRSTRSRARLLRPAIVARPPALCCSGPSRRSSVSIRATTCFSEWVRTGSHTLQNRNPQRSERQVTRQSVWCQR